MIGRAPPLGRVLETALYSDDLARSERFFATVLGLSAMLRTERLVAFHAGAGSVLLLFARGASAADMPSPGGIIPGHDATGPAHMAFAIAADDLEHWRAHLTDHHVPVRSEVAWPRGGHSIYFDDPDGHVLELATPGLWPNY